ncbi:GntR family transcriptional regulator [Streptococcus pneumoniae]|nr:GntR family transcriptional regulator [Streptococcus pneumoniae]
MAIPKYQYIKDELKNKIISGQFSSGDKFYTEAELISMYDVSSITVVRALNDLAKDGYIVRQQGKGTFVSRARKHKLVEFSDIELFNAKDDKVTVLSIERGNKLVYLKNWVYAAINSTTRLNVSANQTVSFISTIHPTSQNNISTQIIQTLNTIVLSIIVSS